MKIKTITFLTLLFLLLTSVGYSQTEVHIDTLFRQAQKHYPLWKQKQLIIQEAALNKKNLRSNYKPQINLVGQATYQTDVTAIELNIPNANLDLPELPYDQYKLNVELNQIIYDGGLTKSKIELATLQGESELAKNDTELYKLYTQISDLFFRYLLLEKSKASLNASQQLLSGNIKTLTSAVMEGVGNRNDLDNLKAENINIDAKLLEIEYARTAIVQSINILTGTKLPADFIFVLPVYDLQKEDKYKRPEFTMLGIQQDLLQAQSGILDRMRMPKVFAFSHLGYGKPGLNMFASDFDTYAILGIGLNWNIYDWGNTKRNRSLLDIRHQTINLQNDILTQNIDLATTQTNSDLKKTRELIEKEKEILNIRERVVERTSNQLKNGTITSNQYLDDLNKLTLSNIRLTKLEMQHRQQMVNYKIQTGEILK